MPRSQAILEAENLYTAFRHIFNLLILRALLTFKGYLSWSCPQMTFTESLEAQSHPVHLLHDINQPLCPNSLVIYFYGLSVVRFENAK